MHTNVKIAEAGLERVRELLGEMLISAEGGAKSDAIRAASEHVVAAIDLLSENEQRGEGLISAG